MIAAKDLFRYSSSFRFGVIILLFILLMVGLSFVSPYEPDDRRAVPRVRLLSRFRRGWAVLGMRGRSARARRCRAPPERATAAR